MLKMRTTKKSQIFYTRQVNVVIYSSIYHTSVKSTLGYYSFQAFKVTQNADLVADK